MTETTRLDHVLMLHTDEEATPSNSGTTNLLQRASLSPPDEMEEPRLFRLTLNATLCATKTPILRDADMLCLSFQTRT